MSEAARPGNLHRPPPIPANIKILGLVLLALPILGMAAVGLVWSQGFDWIKVYKDYYLLHATAALGAFDFLLSYILYQRARLFTLLAARLLSVAWVLMQILMLYSQVRQIH